MMSLTAERRSKLAAIALVVGFCVPAAAQEQRREYIPAPAGTVHAIAAEHGMVVAQERIGAQIGADILRQGGNAVDAAVATGFALAVTYPRAGNIGGGGFMVIHSAERKEDVAIDYRETAPAAATPDMFLGADGKPDIAKSRDSALSIGVPGTVAGLALALEKYGSGHFTLADLLKPSIDLARGGFIIADDMADTLPGIARRLARWPASARIFSRPDGSSLREGDMLVQSDLAATLVGDCRTGPARLLPGPGRGEAGRRDPRRRRHHDVDDLKSYRPVIRAPVRGNYRGYDIVSMPPPSSGGVVLLETLNILEGFPLPDMEQGSAPSLHVMIEAMKRAYADRARYLGDPDFISAPVATLMSKEYAAKAARRHRPRPHHAMDRGPVGDAAARKQQYDAFLGHRQPRQRRQQHLYAEFPLWGRASSPRAPACCSTTNSTISPPRPAPPTPSAWSDSRPICPAPASGRCRRCRRPSC